MTKIDHNRPFLRLINSLERARRREIASSRRVDSDRSEDFFDTAARIECPLCRVQIRSHKIRHHSLKVHGIHSAELFGNEVKLRSELKALYREARECEVQENKICDFVYWLQGAQALLGLDRAQAAHVDELKQIAESRRQSNLEASQRIRESISGLQKKSVDRKAPLRKRQRKRQSKIRR